MKQNILILLDAAGIFLIVLPYPWSYASADENRKLLAASDVNGDEAELSRLLSVIQTHTEIATKSKLNVDYVPGMVTVLEREDLLNRGARDVGEALRLVAGITVSTEKYGTTAIGVRGLSESYNGSSNNMVMLNGIPVNLLVTGIYPFLNIPIGQIERIENSKPSEACRLRQNGKLTIK